MTMAGTGSMAQTIIQGGSIAFNTTVGNAGTLPLSYTVSATGGGLLTGTSSSFSNGALGAGNSDPLGLTVGSGTAGSGTLTWHVDSSNSAVANPSDVIDALTVLAHASPSLSGTGTVDIGKVLGGAVVTAQTDLQNAGNPTGATRANLQVASLSPGLSGATGTTTVAPAGHVTLTALINTGSASYSPGSFTVSTEDDQAYAGKGAIGLGTQTLTVTGTIGYATATGTSFVGGGTLTGTVQASQSLAGLFSVVDKATSPGAMGTQAMILASANLGSQSTVGMDWRQATAAEKVIAHAPIVSDVMNLTGVPEGLDYAMSMTYDDTVGAIAGHEAALAAAGRIYLVSDTSGPWRNAVLDNTASAGQFAATNFQGAFATYQSAVLIAHPTATLADELGAWGVDPSTNVVWAVLNHASDFAVVPEPATMAFLLLGGLGMTAAALRRRPRATKVSNAESIYSFGAECRPRACPTLIISREYACTMGCNGRHCNSDSLRLSGSIRNTATCVTLAQRRRTTTLSSGS